MYFQRKPKFSPLFFFLFFFLKIDSWMLIPNSRNFTYYQLTFPWQEIKSSSHVIPLKSILDYTIEEIGHCNHYCKPLLYRVQDIYSSFRLLVSSSLLYKLDKLKLITNLWMLEIFLWDKYRGMVQMNCLTSLTSCSIFTMLILYIWIGSFDVNIFVWLLIFNRLKVSVWWTSSFHFFFFASIVKELICRNNM